MARGITQARLALDTGIRREDISALENGRRPLFKSWRVRLALALGIPETELIDPSPDTAATTTT